MESDLLGQVTLGIYSVLLIAGGIFGYVKAGSLPSLIAGLVSGLLVLVALAASTVAGVFGLVVGAALAGLMLGVFLARTLKSGKFLPSGLLSVMSLVVLVVVAWEIAD